MPKRSRVQIEEDEKKVLQELEKNSKENVDNIAKKCGFSRQKLMKIINNLEENKTIWGYHPVVDDNKMNRVRFFILLKRSQKHLTEEKINIVVNRGLRQMATKLGVELESSFFVHGLYDGVMCITATDINQVRRFCDSISTLFKGAYISKVHILEVLFPIERNGFDNPYREELRGFF